MTGTVFSGTRDVSVVRRYLLGRLTPEALEEVEARLFSKDQLFWDRLCLEEDQLIDEYVGGALDDESRSDLERHFLCTEERRAKVEFVGLLRDRARHERARQARRPSDWLKMPVAVPRWALAAAATLLLLMPAAAWQWTTRTAQQEITTWLSADLVRAGGELTRVHIPPNCRVVRLHLDPGTDAYRDYRATLHDVSGVELWAQGQLQTANVQGGNAITLTFPCELLPEGDYHARLHGLSPGAPPVRLRRYDFRVLRD